MERWMNFQWKHPPIFQTFRATNFSSNNLDAIEKELRQIAHTHSPPKKHRYGMILLDQTLGSDISGIQDVQSYSPVHNVTFQKYSAMTLNKLPLPRNSKEFEEQSSGRILHFLHSTNPKQYKHRNHRLVGLRQ